MVIYAIYHCVRCAWSETVVDLELTQAENLWLSNAPVKRSSLAVYHISNMVVPAIVKTLLLAVVLARDVGHIELLSLRVLGGVPVSKTELELRVPEQYTYLGR